MTTNYQQIKTQINSPFIRAVGLVFVPLIITLIIYWPGLKGSFLFDDYPNFEPLGSTAQTSTYTRIVNFIFTGGAGPTGRPVSLASFIINDNAWPSNAWGFKYTNLMIHLLNGLLIFWLLYKLLIITKHTEKTASVIAALTSLVWLVHPLNVSTVLYIIQRMTQLGTLFMLAGLISFIYGREFLRLEKIPAALWCLCLAYPIFGLLAIFSKEMGVSLLLYVLVLEVTVLQNTSVKKYLAGYKYWYLTFVLVPLFLVIAYLSATFAPEIYNQRDFTLGERLLTETRILLDYLSQILFPRLAHGGVYQDDYLISRSIFDPITTLFSISALLLIFILSIKYRKRYPYYCLAGLWFLGGHALESSFIALELYFEHRNYLPMLAPILALIYFVVTDKSRLKKVKFTALFIFILLSMLYTGINTSLWGTPREAAVIWANEHPASVRAQQSAAYEFTITQQMEEAKKFLRVALAHKPLDGGLLIQFVFYDCLSGTLTENKLQDLYATLPLATRSLAATSAIIKLSTMANKDVCPPLDNAQVLRMIEILLGSDKFQSASELHALYYTQGKLYAAQGQLDPAITALDKSFKYRKVIDIPMQQAIWLSSAGLLDPARKYINIAKQYDKKSFNPFLKNSRAKEIDVIENSITQSSISNDRINSSNEILAK